MLRSSRWARLSGLLSLAGAILVSPAGTLAQQNAPGGGGTAPGGGAQPGGGTQPVIVELPPDEPGASGSRPGGGGAAITEADLVRGLQGYRFRTAATTTLGGYGELHYNLQWNDDFDAHESEIDLHRLVVFIAHNFSDRFRFYTEIEVEHALASSGTPGQVGIEQAFVDWRVLEDRLGLRAGVVLVPLGIINQWHEPPIFHGVERPRVDRNILPSTWREGGIGIFGEPTEWLRYELYAVGGLDASSFDAGSAIRGGRQGISEANARGLAVTGRVEVEPMMGLVAGLSGYFGLAGPNAHLHDAMGEEVELDVPVGVYAADVRLRLAGFEARALGAYGFIGESAELAATFLDEEGMDPAPRVGSSFYGVYGEVAYDVLRPIGGTDHQLLPFVRFERYDTMASTEGSIDDDDELAVNELVFGVSYRPIPQLVFKGDLTLRMTDADDDEDTHVLSLGTGFMF